MPHLKIAIQKSGRLSDDSLKLLESCGIKFAKSKDKLFWYGRNMPVDLLLIRDDDIPRLLLDGVCDLGICGQNVAEECALERQINSHDLKAEVALGFGDCRLCLAIPEDQAFESIHDLNGKRIATSYPSLTQQYLDKNNIQADIVELSGAVEIAQVWDLLMPSLILFLQALHYVQTTYVKWLMSLRANQHCIAVLDN